jgi:hypothetical protein
MALTNIFREPRREIIETISGITAAVIGLGVLLMIAGIFMRFSNPEMYEESAIGAAVVGLVVAFIVIVLGTALLIALHEIGEALCNSFQSIGIRLRPKRRY